MTALFASSRSCPFSSPLGRTFRPLVARADPATSALVLWWKQTQKCRAMGQRLVASTPRLADTCGYINGLLQTQLVSTSGWPQQWQLSIRSSLGVQLPIGRIENVSATAHIVPKALLFFSKSQRGTSQRPQRCLETGSRSTQRSVNLGTNGAGTPPFLQYGAWELPTPDAWKALLHGPVNKRAHTAVLKQNPHSNWCGSVPTEPPRGHGGRFITLSQQ